MSTAVFLILLTGTNVMAASSGRETIYLQSSQMWNKRSAVSRTGNFSYGEAACYAVYPGSGTDNYEKVQVKLYLGSTGISDDYTISEKDTKFTSIYIKEGYLSSTSIEFAFRGNNPNLDAYADIAYIGK